MIATILTFMLLTTSPKGLGGCPVSRDHNGRIHRSAQAINAFRRTHPCPGGRDRGSTVRCRGYVIDHIVPLACHGCDVPANMQYQTVAAGKAKDKVERRQCGGQ